MIYIKKILEYYISLSVRMKAAIWFTFCSFMQKGIAFITVPIFTRLLSTDEYGIYTLYLSWLQILLVISSLYLYYGVTDNAMAKFEKDRNKFISSMQGLTVTITSLLLVITALFMDRIKDFLGLSPVLIFLIFIELYVTPAFFFWAARQKFEYRYKRLVVITLIRSICNPVLGLIAVYLMNDRALARIGSIVVVELVICGLIMFYQFNKGRVFFDRNYWIYALTLAIPMVPHYLSGIILSQGDRVMIAHMVGKTELALYSVAYSIGMLVQLFVTAINSSLTPWVYSRLKAREIYEIQKKSVGVMLLISIISVALMLLSPELVLLLGSEKYREAVYVIPPISASIFFIFLYSFLSYPEFYYEKTRFLAIASILAAVINIVLNYFFIPIYGFIAAAYTTLACYIIYSIGHYIVARKILYAKVNEFSVINSKIALALSIILVLVGSFIHYSFEWEAVRYIIIVSICVGILYKRKSIRKYVISKR